MSFDAGFPLVFFSLIIVIIIIIISIVIVIVIIAAVVVCRRRCVVHDQVDWSWWVVFLPTWLVLFGLLLSYYLDYSLAKKLVAGTGDKDEDELTQVGDGRKKQLPGTQTVVNSPGSRFIPVGASLSVGRYNLFLSQAVRTP